MIKVKVKQKGSIQDAIKRMKQLNKTTATVGYHENNELSMIAGVHEFGTRIKVTDKMRGYLASQGMPLKASTTEIMIPERSFLRTGAALAEKDIQKAAEKYINDVLAGSISPKQFAKDLGEALKEVIVNHAEDLNNPKNHPFTIEEKGKNDPLEDSGRLLKGIEVKVE